MREQLRLAAKFIDRGEINNAKSTLEEYLASNPQDPDCLHLLGVAANKEKTFDLAISYLTDAIALRDTNPHFYFNLAVSLKALNKLEEAIECYDKCILIDPHLAEPYLNRGIVLKQLQRLDEAIESHSKAIALNPQLALAFNNRGLAYQANRQLVLAAKDFIKATSIRPDYADAHANLGNVQRELKNYSLAIESYEAALRINPSLPYLHGLLIHSRMCNADWRGFENELKRLLLDVHAGKRASPSFPLLSLVDDPLAHLKCSQTWMAHRHPPDNSLGPIQSARPEQLSNNRIRVAYISADFRDHPVSYLMAQVFELHDKQRFELFAISLSPSCEDDMHRRVVSAFDNFIYADKQNDKEIAALCRKLSVDIAIDLGGLTDGSRPGIFACRAAPIQLSYLGYLGTIGSPYFDFIIADSVIVSPQDNSFFSEKILSLPWYQANDQFRQASESTPTRAELGIPENAFVYCCLNNTYKITPGIFSSWMKILKEVPGSVLLLLSENDDASTNLRMNAALYGIEPSRILFCNRTDRPRYLARYKLADLFLDTLPYNAGTTASDALWSGLPVLTFAGKSFASRVGASLLTALEMSELITFTSAQYESMAISIGTHPEKLAHIKQKLLHQIASAPLFDSSRFTQYLERGLTAIYQRYSAHLAPINIVVDTN